MRKVTTVVYNLYHVLQGLLDLIASVSFEEYKVPGWSLWLSGVNIGRKKSSVILYICKLVLL